MIPRTFSPQKNPNLGGSWGRRRRLAAVLVGEEEGKKGRVGEKGPVRAQNIALVAPARMARQGCRATCTGATSLSRHAGWRDKANVLGPR